MARSPRHRRQAGLFAVLEGECRVVSSGRPPIIVRQGDFVLSPSTSDHIVESIEAPPHGIAMMPVEIGEGRFRIGPPSEPVNLRMQVGLCSFSSPDAALLVSLLPAMIVARGRRGLRCCCNWWAMKPATQGRDANWCWNACSRCCWRRCALALMSRPYPVSRAAVG
jgi:hypothetical protein